VALLLAAGEPEARPAAGPPFVTPVVADAAADVPAPAGGPPALPAAHAVSATAPAAAITTRAHRDELTSGELTGAAPTRADQNMAFLQLRHQLIGCHY
jgi:hypothetical protein